MKMTCVRAYINQMLDKNVVWVVKSFHEKEMKKIENDEKHSRDEQNE